MERDNDFCTSCHLAPGRPLHAHLRRDFDAAPPATLAAAHGVAGRGVFAAGAGFRCIDCHGGTGFVGRARVKALAARDSFWYVVGRFEEPQEMRWPLWDADCRKCHPRFDTAAVEAWQSPRFHQLPVHNAALSVGCVECHDAHESGGNPTANFLHAPLVRAQCARCHPQYEEGIE